MKARREDITVTNGLAFSPPVFHEHICQHKRRRENKQELLMSKRLLMDSVLYDFLCLEQDKIDSWGDPSLGHNSQVTSGGDFWVCRPALRFCPLSSFISAEMMERGKDTKVVLCFILWQCFECVMKENFICKVEEILGLNPKSISKFKIDNCVTLDLLTNSSEP